MDTSDSEESSIYSSVLEESFEDPSPDICNDFKYDSCSDDSSPSNKNPKQTAKNSIPFLKKLYCRELCGYFARDAHSRSRNLSAKGQVCRQIRLHDILPISAIKLNHVFLGLTKCGQFLLSYTYTTELDVESFNTLYKYRLHWWSFVPQQKVRKVSEVMLFGNNTIHSMLYIAVCQWATDHSRVLIYGNCFDTHMGLSAQGERSYLTVTTVPSLNKCIDCLKVAASYEEEDLAASWDSCVRFNCLKHGLTVHSTFDVVSPYPKFDPAVSMRLDGTVVLNTGNFLHALQTDLENIGKKYSPSAFNNGKSECSEDYQTPDLISVASDNTFAPKHEVASVIELECWMNDPGIRTKPFMKNGDTSKSSALKLLSVDPTFSQQKFSGCDDKDGAININASFSTSDRTKYIRKTNEEDDSDNMVLEFLDDSSQSGMNTTDFNKLTDVPCIKPINTQNNKVVSSESRSNIIVNNFNRTNERLIISKRIDEKHQLCISDGSNSKCSYSYKKYCDFTKQYSNGNVESSNSDLDSESYSCKIMKDNNTAVTRERLVKEFANEVYSSKFLKLQNCKDKQGTSDNCEGSSSEQLLEGREEELFCVGASKKPCFGDEYNSKDEFERPSPWMKDQHYIDSTQELNIACGNLNPSNDSIVTSVTLLSPVTKPGLVKSMMEDFKVDEKQTSGEQKKESSRAASPPWRKRTRYGVPVKLSSPLPSLSSNSPRVHSKMAAEAEKAYEFTEDGLDSGCEKLSSFRRRRLADKKYEFCEEGEDAENIVPYRFHCRRETSSALRSTVPFPLSPYSHRRRFQENADNDISGPRSPQNTLSINNEILSLSPISNHVDSDKIVLRPLDQNTTALLSPRDRDISNNDKPKTVGNRKQTHLDLLSLPEDNLPTSEEMLTDNAEILNCSLTSELNSANPDINDCSPVKCTLSLKRRFIEVDDELISVITDIEDDDSSDITGYHCALPLEVHGSGYSQLQMISNSKAEKLMVPCVLITQRSFDVERFCHEMAEQLCEESGKKYWFCNDYDVEIVDVCPFSGDVVSVAMMRIQATVKTKGLAKSQRHPVSSQQRRQYQGGCKFAWNTHTGKHSVIETKALTEVDPYAEFDIEPWNPARELAQEIRASLPQIPLYQSVRSISNWKVLRGFSLKRLTDLENLIELIL